MVLEFPELWFAESLATALLWNRCMCLGSVERRLIRALAIAATMMSMIPLLWMRCGCHGITMRERPGHGPVCGPGAQLSSAVLYLYSGFPH